VTLDTADIITRADVRDVLAGMDLARRGQNPNA
jgi:hypothetical protein